MSFRKPVLPAGSTPWLLAHEMRVAWRGSVGRGGAASRGLWIGAGVMVLFTAFAGIPLGLLLRRIEIDVTPMLVILADGALVVIFTIMLSQTLATAAETLYVRGDLDLLFTSPLPPRRSLTVRFAAMAANLYFTFAVLISPLLAPVALLAHPPWMAAYLVLGCVTLLATAVGLALALALFALIGPRRTRTLAQLTAALIGAAFFLSTQLQNILGGRQAESVWSRLTRFAETPGIRPPPLAAWPLRALMGEPVPLAVICLGSLGVYVLVIAWLSDRFVAASGAAMGADAVAGPRRRGRVRFPGGPFRALLAKELRLIARDAALLSQVVLRVLYLMPLGFLLIRNAGRGQDLLLPGGAAGLVLLAGQVAGSLAWITVSAEDAGELLSASPNRVSLVHRAKLAAAFLPLAVLLAPLLIALGIFAPLAGIAAALGCAAVAWACGLINIWYQKPGRRQDFRRRRAQAWFASLAELVLSLLIAAATGMAAAGMAWGAIPLVVAGLALLALRRSDAQIARAVAAG